MTAALNSITLSERYLRPRDAALFLGYSEKTLANWRSQGTGPRYKKLSRRFITYKVADLQKYIEERDKA